MYLLIVTPKDKGIPCYSLYSTKKLAYDAEKAVVDAEAELPIMINDTEIHPITPDLNILDILQSRKTSEEHRAEKEKIEKIVKFLNIEQRMKEASITISDLKFMIEMKNFNM